MEAGTSDDAPTLISNVQVLELLQRNLQGGDDNENSTQPSQQSKKQRWKQRDWIQRQVVQYLQSTPCVKLDPARRQEFHSLLVGRKRRIRAPVVDLLPPTADPMPTSPPSPDPTPPVPDEVPSFVAEPLRDSSHTNDVSPEPQVEPQKSEQEPSELLEEPAELLEFTGFGLTEAEAMQILNFMPTEAVELHLVIDDLNARLTPQQQDALLEAISRYSIESSCQTNEPCSPSNHPVTQADEEGSAVDDESKNGYLSQNNHKTANEPHLNGY